MFGNGRYTSLIALAALTLPVCASVVYPGYLATVGPVPLRFSTPLTVPTNIFVPPPSPVVVEPPMPPKIDAKPAPKPAPSVVLVPVPVLPPPGSAPAPPSDEVVSPQMLLKYFNRGTNGGPSVGIASPDFTPPRASEPLPSKATYSTTP